MKIIVLSILLALTAAGCVGNLRTPRPSERAVAILPSGADPFLVRETAVPQPEIPAAPVVAAPEAPREAPAVSAPPASLPHPEPAVERSAPTDPLKPIEIRRPERPPEIPADPTLPPAAVREPVRNSAESAAMPSPARPVRDLQSGSTRIGDLERLGDGSTLIRSGSTVIRQGSSGTTLQATKPGELPTFLIDSKGRVNGPTAISTSGSAPEKMPSQPFLAPSPVAPSPAAKGPAPVTGYTPGERQSFSNMPQRPAAPSPVGR